jgi:hypothetical protein
VSFSAHWTRVTTLFKPQRGADGKPELTTGSPSGPTRGFVLRSHAPLCGANSRANLCDSCNLFFIVQPDNRCPPFATESFLNYHGARSCWAYLFRFTTHIFRWPDYFHSFPRRYSQLQDSPTAVAEFHSSISPFLGTSLSSPHASTVTLFAHRSPRSLPIELN